MLLWWQKQQERKVGNRMIYLELFFSFLKVGLFSFGGYAAIPLIREVVLEHQWLSDEMVSYMIAVSESTPGPIMVNMATYIGKSQGGFWGAVVATLAMILPAFIIILLITIHLKTWMKNRYVQAALGGMEPCIIGIIMATGAYMTLSNCILMENPIACDGKSLFLAVLLIVCMYGYKYVKKKKISPILLLVISACLGMVIF